MTEALRGEHYCIVHQGNSSHYAKHNCRVCQLEQALALALQPVDPPEVTDPKKRLRTLKKEHNLPNKFYYPFGHQDILELINIVEAICDKMESKL